jgi:hypothetical protein
MAVKLRRKWELILANYTLSFAKYAGVAFLFNAAFGFLLL